MTDQRDPDESHEALRWRFASTIRRLQTTAEADELLQAFERAVVAQADGPTALDALEAQPDWDHGTLLQAVLEMDTPSVPELDAGGLMRLREYQLIGWLGDAVQDALEIGDLDTAMRVSRLAHHVLVRTQCGAVLGVDEGVS